MMSAAAGGPAPPDPTILRPGILTSVTGMFRPGYYLMFHTMEGLVIVTSVQKGVPQYIFGLWIRAPSKITFLYLEKLYDTKVKVQATLKKTFLVIG